MAEHHFTSDLGNIMRRLSWIMLVIFRSVVGPDFLFIDDNACPHKTDEVSNILEIGNIECTNWPAYSPDLNPKQHAWDAFGRCISQRTHPSRTVQN